jgi:hypothetical protein
MADKSSKPTIRIELTEQQKEQVKQLTGKAVQALELTAEELDDRTSPSRVTGPCDVL